MEGALEEADRQWLCPWCGTVARLPTQHSVLCHSRTCECGALALGAPPWDTDEIIDDAIGIFGIADRYMTPYDADRILGLQEGGVEVAEDPRMPSGDDKSSQLRILWFRRKAGGSKPTNRFN